MVSNVAQRLVEYSRTTPEMRWCGARDFSSDAKRAGAPNRAGRGTQDSTRVHIVMGISDLSRRMGVV
jgi:hypothetical protein